MEQIKYFLFNKIYQKIAGLSIISSIFLLHISGLGYSNSKKDFKFITTFNHDLLQSGDIVFRKGNGLLSQALFSADENSKFSHVGVVKLINNQPFVIHASTGEPLGTDAVVKSDLLEIFLQRDFTSAVAVYRLQNPNHKISEKAATIAYNYAQKQLPFDSEFNLKTKDSLYCTELVWRAYLEAGIDLVDNKFNQLDIPFNQGLYLLPSGLLSSPYIQEIYLLTLDKAGHK